MSKKIFFNRLFMLIIFIAALSYEVPSEASGKAIVITSPADGAVIHGASVDVTFELRNKGAKGDHVHLYLDGRLVKPLHGKKVTYTIDGLRGGGHTIVIKFATKRHKILDTEDSVTIEVK